MVAGASSSESARRTPCLIVPQTPMADLLEYFAVVLFEWLELSLLGKTNMQPGIELQNYWERPFLAQELLGAIGWVVWPTEEALRVRDPALR